MESVSQHLFVPLTIFGRNSVAFLSKLRTNVPVYIVRQKNIH